MSPGSVEVVLTFVQLGPAADFVPTCCDDALWPAVREAWVLPYDPA